MAGTRHTMRLYNLSATLGGRPRHTTVQPHTHTTLTNTVTQPDSHWDASRLEHHCTTTHHPRDTLRQRLQPNDTAHRGSHPQPRSDPHPSSAGLGSHSKQTQSLPSGTHTMVKETDTGKQKQTGISTGCSKCWEEK